MHTCTIQRIDGKQIIKLPENVSAQDFTDWLNDEPNRKPLSFNRLPEVWTSAEDDES